MRTFHYIDPNQKERFCDACNGWGYNREFFATKTAPDCAECGGDGRLGDPVARPEIMVVDIRCSDGSTVYGWRIHPFVHPRPIPFDGRWRDTYPTIADALAAARKAISEGL